MDSNPVRPSQLNTTLATLSMRCSPPLNMLPIGMARTVILCMQCWDHTCRQASFGSCADHVYRLDLCFCSDQYATQSGQQKSRTKPGGKYGPNTVCTNEATKQKHEMSKRMQTK